jgi:hypothetical protein
MTGQKRPYLAYLLRLWQVAVEGGPGWRASLENAHTGQRQAFASLDDLFAFLRRQTAGIGAVEGKDGERQTGEPDEDQGRVGRGQQAGGWT